MRALTLFDRVRSRHVLPLALCAGVLALSGCPKMPRISTALPSPTAPATATPKPSPSPSSSVAPEASPTPADEPTSQFMTVGNSPQSVLIDASGNGYVSLSDDLLRIDGAIGNLSNTKTTSLKASGFTFGAPSGVVQVGSAIWFTDKARGQVRQIPSDSTNTTQDIAFGTAPTRLVKDAQDNLWIADSDAQLVGILKPDGFSTPHGASLDGVPDDLLVDLQGTGWALVTLGDTVKVAKLTRALNGNDLTGLDVAFQAHLTALGSGVGLALDEQNGLWVAGVAKNGEGQLMKVDPSNGTPTADFNFQTFIPGRFAIRGGFAWIPDNSPSGSQIFKVSLATGAIVNSYSLGGRGTSVFKDATGDLWVPIGSGTTVVKLDF